MENLNTPIIDDALILRLFESSSIAFCSNKVIMEILKKNGFDGNSKLAGMKLAKFAKPYRKRNGKNVNRGWMIKYIGPAL